MTNHLLLGTITPDGTIDARPVIAEIAPDGTVAAWRLLTGHEPHSTTPLRALLDLPTLSLQPL